ncbi:tetratricopeptide repeat protein [Zunongwangia endophytica]|uniref:Tetratricopeptide repeat protein n=1 Tax=Zunongwangia endophytica TaxID=1808945 RepID=A0ABV8H6M3_9FLAO|nr:tetratricopeptide repeat protein [Zunongwangia endophytica]MDN3596105.1 tetratricopeptide repeat protein [Zunongwangia endophytica]
MKKIFFIILVFCTTVGFAQSESIFENANKQYADGNYEQAIKAYEKILDEGEASVSVYYNLGNAHYKLNHIAPSIFYYEKALQLKPNDADVKNNIQFARNMAMDDIETIEQTGVSKTVNNLISTFSFNTWGIIAIGFMMLFVVLFLLYYYGRSVLLKRVLFATAVVCIICSVISVIFAFNQQNLQLDNNYAIVFSAEADVRSEPNLRGEPSFVLHEGTKTKLLENYQEWYKIELADGKQGWIKKDSIKEL